MEAYGAAESMTIDLSESPFWFTGFYQTMVYDAEDVLVSPQLLENHLWSTCSHHSILIVTPCVAAVAG